MMTSPTRQKRGLTLVELLLSLSISTALMVGIASSMILASRAIPNPDSALVATGESYRTAEEIAGELYTAQGFNERSATAVEFTVADRDGDTNPEVIRYAWSGTRGDPLTRQINGGTVISISDNVDAFNLSYNVRTVTTTQSQQSTVESAETLLASFDGWSGISPTTNTSAMSTTSVDSQYFEITVPAGTTSIRPTRVMIMLSLSVLTPQAILVSLQRSKADGSYQPDMTPIGSSATIPGAVVTVLPSWHTGAFTNTVVTDPDRTDYCLVVQLQGSTLALLTYYSAKSAPDDGMYYLWSSDSGASWNPASKDINKQDLRFYLYGVYRSSSVQQTQTSRYFVDAVNIAVQIGPDEDTTSRTSVPILNAPEVSSP